MKHRKLRIAWSVAWATICFALTALWIAVIINLDWFVPVPRPPSGNGTDWNLRLGHSQFRLTLTMPDRNLDLREMRRINLLGFDWQGTWKQISLAIPYWFPILLSALLAVIPWLKPRFSLRTVLIAMAIVSIAMTLAIIAFGIIR
jgi:hypothetical protein